MEFREPWFFSPISSRTRGNVFHPGFDHHPLRPLSRSLTRRENVIATDLVMRLATELLLQINDGADPCAVGRQLYTVFTLADLGLMPQSDPFGLYADLVSVGPEVRTEIFNFLLAYDEEEERLMADLRPDVEELVNALVTTVLPN